jgi:hypothetical protein
MIAGFFIHSPLFGAQLSSGRDSTQDHLLSNSHREILDMRTWKFIALMTSVIALISCAISDLTLFAVHEPIIGQASVAANSFG